MNKTYLLLIILSSFILVSASINDSKLTICNSINLTGPNCTIWWDNLNLTDNMTNIVINYNTYTNETYYENYTYNYRDNQSQSYYDSRYIQESELPNRLVDYAKKGEINPTQIINNTTIQTIKQNNFTWWNALTLMLLVSIMAIAYFLFRIIKEINYLER